MSFKEKIKKLAYNEKLWYRVGIFDLIVGFLARDVFLIIVGIGLIYLNRKQREKKDESSS